MIESSVLADHDITLLTDRIIFTKPAGRLLWRLPAFPLSGGEVQAANPQFISSTAWNEGAEIFLACVLNAAVTLHIQIQSNPASPFIRLRYSLSGDAMFSGHDGQIPISHGCLETEFTALSEISLSSFDRIYHSFTPAMYRYEKAEQAVSREELSHGLLGPIVIAESNEQCLLMAYEHGAQVPDGYLRVYPCVKGLRLVSTKGNYYNGQPVGEYLAPWIDLGITTGDIRPAFREHVRLDMSVDHASRYPYIFYNTWNYQERNKYLKNKPYLDEMNEERILAEINAAHHMGIEVFVIDTGWFQRAGDWEVDKSRFPGGLKNIKELLDANGMKLGLWFNPTLAATDAEIMQSNPEFIMRSGGKDWLLDDVWEKGACYGLCLASGFTDALIKKFITLHDQLGVQYYKLDGIYQYGCESAEHWHGTPENDLTEIRDAYAYRMALELARLAEEVSRSRPGVIVDFDITENARSMGLAFLSGGKYFSINNGPYYESFDIPATHKRSPDTINVFFHPGPARSQICRASSRFDGIVPSTLFLTHFLPDGDDLARQNAAASLVLGGNGIWGDLPSLTLEEMDFWHNFFIQYKKVREAAAAAYPICTGEIGGSPEIHEKIDASSGVGFVVFFTTGPGEYTYVTQPLSKCPSEVRGADEFLIQADGRVWLSVRLEADGARTVFFLP